MTLHSQALCNEPNTQTTASMINGTCCNFPVCCLQAIPNNHTHKDYTLHLYCLCKDKIYHIRYLIKHKMGFVRHCNLISGYDWDLNIPTSTLRWIGEGGFSILLQQMESQPLQTVPWHWPLWTQHLTHLRKASRLASFPGQLLSSVLSCGIIERFAIIIVEVSSPRYNFHLAFFAFLHATLEMKCHLHKRLYQRNTCKWLWILVMVKPSVFVFECVCFGFSNIMETKLHSVFWKPNICEDKPPGPAI